MVTNTGRVGSPVQDEHPAGDPVPGFRAAAGSARGTSGETGDTTRRPADPSGGMARTGDAIVQALALLRLPPAARVVELSPRHDAVSTALIAMRAAEVVAVHATPWAAAHAARVLGCPVDTDSLDGRDPLPPPDTFPLAAALPGRVTVRQVAHPLQLPAAPSGHGWDALVAWPAVPLLPRAWVEAVRPGGVLLATLELAPLAGANALVRVRVQPDGQPVVEAVAPGWPHAFTPLTVPHDELRPRHVDLTEYGDDGSVWTLSGSWLRTSNPDAVRDPGHLCPVRGSSPVTARLRAGAP